MLSVWLASCGNRDGSQARTIETPADLQPGAAPGSKANLVLKDIQIPVTVTHKTKDNEVILTLETAGVPFEIERYLNEPKQFSFVGLQLADTEASGEFYQPPVPLLKFPMNIGDSWEWSGKSVSGDQPHKGRAKITTSSQTSLVKVQVDLELESGGPNPAKRTLTFWFSPGKGVVKREFGESSSRISLEE